MPGIEPVSAAIGIGGSILGGIMGGAAARRAKRRARKQVKAFHQKGMLLKRYKHDKIHTTEDVAKKFGLKIRRNFTIN